MGLGDGTGGGGLRCANPPYIIEMIEFFGSLFRRGDFAVALQKRDCLPCRAQTALTAWRAAISSGV